MKMKLDILFHYEVNETTGEVTFIGKEEVKVDTAKPAKTTIENDDIPKVVLSNGKLTLSTAAVKLLKAIAGDKVDIKYKTNNGTTMPVIGTEQFFKTATGNKLTKSNTVSFRGKANETLLEYGTEFTLEPTDSEGIFYLLGNKEIKKQPVPDEILDINKELDELNLLDDLNIEEDDNELNKFNFTL